MGNITPIKDWNNSCPFCGGEAWIDCDPKSNIYWVECKECGAKSTAAKVEKQTMPTFETVGEAEAFIIGAWERRAED